MKLLKEPRQLLSNQEPVFSVLRQYTYSRKRIDCRIYFRYFITNFVASSSSEQGNSRKMLSIKNLTILRSFLLLPRIRRVPLDSTVFCPRAALITCCPCSSITETCSRWSMQCSDDPNTLKHALRKKLIQMPRNTLAQPSEQHRIFGFPNLSCL